MHRPLPGRLPVRLASVPIIAIICAALAGQSACAEAGSRKVGDTSHAAIHGAWWRCHLDAPILFARRHSYIGIHIYDTYYKWKPGGGLYVIENPADPPAEHRVRPIIDPTTPETLGEGIYSDPELSWDARRVLFCFKGEPNGSNAIYEIGIDGKDLRRLTDPRPSCEAYKGRGGGVHDVAPAYLPDGRIVFLSSRPNGLVPCNNTGVAILHVMNPDGSDIHPISVNNVNEFDPVPLPDGRILFGRWEYIDKTALTIQSLWTVFPDGTNETALFANNMVFPEALLDARPVPDSMHLVAATLAPHNSPPRGTVGIVNPLLGKNAPHAITNFEHPDKPTHDRGNSCEPWPLSENVLLFSGRPKGAAFNAIEIMDRTGRRHVVHAEPGICCHSPMPVRPRPRPPSIPDATDRTKTTGRFYVQDIHKGLDGVEPGEVTHLRIIEETSRTSPSPGGAMNQTFLMSGVLAWSAKNILGTVDVADDGSAYFEAPAGRALYLQALDADGRLVRSMRTFIQAAPGVTRSCIGCHEHKYSTPANLGDRRAFRRPPARPRPESWGSGFIDYPSMIQPVFDRHCLPCHGGEKGLAARLDLSGGWTEYFSISYENLAGRRRSQTWADLIAAIDCMNGTSLFSARILGPHGHGSGAAPLADVLVSGHQDRLPGLTPRERDLVLAWIDTNGLYHGTWDYSTHGPRLKAWNGIKAAVVSEMGEAGCMECHGKNGKPTRFENDWINLRRPEFSRVLRAPLAKEADGGYGLALCRKRPIDPNGWRSRIMVLGGYQHAVRPVASFDRPAAPKMTEDGEPGVTFRSTDDPHYQSLLATIRRGRREALAAPRVDMPGAEVVAGSHRQRYPQPLPDPLPDLSVGTDGDAVVHLSWERSARTIGLSAEVHRGPGPDFAPSETTRLAETALFHYADASAPVGIQHYAVVLVSAQGTSRPIRARVDVPAPAPPAAPTGLAAEPEPGRVLLRWQGGPDLTVRYVVSRAAAGSDAFKPLTAVPTTAWEFADVSARSDEAARYTVRAVSRRGGVSPPAPAVEAKALPEIREPVFTVDYAVGTDAADCKGRPVAATLHGKARVAEGALDLRAGGHVTYPHRDAFDLAQRFSVACRVRFEEAGQMPVVVSCGQWQKAGWFLQRFGGGWRWHVGGIDCDGGTPAVGRWVHLVGTYDGSKARLFQDGRLVAERDGIAVTTPWKGPLHVGQYSAGPADPYQVTGQIQGLRIYSRALPADEIAGALDALAAGQ